MEPLTAIVGHGLIGGSIELALRRSNAGAVVTLDKDDDLARIAGADLVILAAPIAANVRILADLPRVLTSPAIVSDTGSTKVSTVTAAAALPPHLRFVGGHPMAGAATGGRESARADLFEGKPWILTPGDATRPGDLERVRGFVTSLGAVPQVMDAQDHDRLLAFISHLPQLAVSALMDVAGRNAGEAGLALAGAGLRDSTRLAGSPAALWREIVADNRANVDEALDALMAILQRLRADRDGSAIEEIFASAAEWKQVLEQSPRHGQP